MQWGIAVTARDESGDAEWDERYSSTDQVWSGNVNGVLAAEVEGLDPGRALDVGCGEGADAVWLASRGWQVTAIDVSTVAIERGTKVAEQAQVHVNWLHYDLLDAPLPSVGFDLVSAQYPALLRTTSQEAEHALIAAVAPRGHLLVVHHMLTDEVVTEARSHGFDPDAFVSPSDLSPLLDESWQIAFDEWRPREHVNPDAHHAHDVVLHAQRLL
jgi:SAM-dependent methyltransferase